MKDEEGVWAGVNMDPVGGGGETKTYPGLEEEDIVAQGHQPPWGS